MAKLEQEMLSRQIPISFLKLSYWKKCLINLK
jgi:hypothetical protein